jgi:hypothetical protein
MAGFDLDSLVEFQPPTHLCENCFAINQPDFRAYGEDEDPTCSVCGVRYIGTDDYASSECEKYFEYESRNYVRFSRPLIHGQKLAKSARELRADTHRQPRVTRLNDLLLGAEHFIHFMSFNINHIFIGVLKLLSHKVQVRGIVSNVEDFAYSELIEYGHEAPNFQCKVLEGEETAHSKLIVVDGLVALHGSVNLILKSWRSIDQKRENLAIETDLSRVRDMNNNLFSHIWQHHTRNRDYIYMMNNND